MSAYQQLIEGTQEEFHEQLLHHPLIADLRAGNVNLFQYVSYLRETWHLVRHTSRIFALAAARVPDDRWPLKEWLMRQALDEHGHEQLCLADLRHWHLDPSVITASRPGAGAWGLVTQDYFYATAGDPLCLLGTASLSEQLGATVAAPVLQALNNIRALGGKGTGFIRAHGALDGGHLDQLAILVDRLVGIDDLPQVQDARLRAIGFSARLLNDVRGAVVS